MTKKRFIAGATCPECSTADSLRVWTQDQTETVECVECTYVEVKVESTTEKMQSPSNQTQANQAQAYTDKGVIGLFTPD